MAVRLSALRTSRALLPRDIIVLLLILISVGLMRPEGLGKLKIFIHIIVSRTRYLPACSVLPCPVRYHMLQYRSEHNIKVDV
jgi:hypothetical protein